MYASHGMNNINRKGRGGGAAKPPPSPPLDPLLLLRYVMPVIEIHLRDRYIGVTPLIEIHLRDRPLREKVHLPRIY